jgi:hypothetical protein
VTRTAPLRASLVRGALTRTTLLPAALLRAGLLRAGLISAAQLWALQVSAALLLAVLLVPQRSHAGELNLATLSCAKYENEVLAATAPGFEGDPIDTVMWLFGFSVAKAGERVMYGDSLPAFGFSMDTVCKSNPTMSLLEAVTTAKSKRDHPMDLTSLDCSTFETRHASLRKSDPESATTLTMWLFGYAVGLSGGHVLDAGATPKFDEALDAWCVKHPGDSVFDALRAPNPAVPATKSAPHFAPSSATRPAPR